MKVVNDKKLEDTRMFIKKAGQECPAYE